MPTNFEPYISSLYYSTDEDSEAFQKLLLDGYAVISVSKKKKEDLGQEISACWDDREE